MTQLVEFTLFYAVVPMIGSSLSGGLTGKSQIQSRLMSERLMKVNAGSAETLKVIADHGQNTCDEWFSRSREGGCILK